MSEVGTRLARTWIVIGTRFMPFADVATPELPLGRLFRLSLFQVSVGMAAVLLIGTLNRVMIVELAVPAWLVATMVALPLVFAPLRALIGFRSDTHRSVLGWRRIPYLWFGTLIQFGGLAIMPFALIVLSGDSNGPAWVGPAGAALAFLMLGAGLHMTQTVGLALATDLTDPEQTPKVVAFLCVMLMVGMMLAAFVFGWALTPFSQVRLIQVIQGAALATMVLNVVALWKQEPRVPGRTARDLPRESFAEGWAELSRRGQGTRALVAIGLGTAGFSMQDILLEPYGGQILHLTVGQTTLLTAMLAGGGLVGFLIAARRLGLGADPYRLAGIGALFGIVAFSAVVCAAPLMSAAVFAVGVTLIGFGGGLFAHSTLTAAMNAAPAGRIGLALGTWSAVQATAAGIAIAAGGFLRDAIGSMAEAGSLGPVLSIPATGYSLVYHLEIALLFATLVALGPLVRRGTADEPRPRSRLGLAGTTG